MDYFNINAGNPVQCLTQARPPLAERPACGMVCELQRQVLSFGPQTTGI